MEIVINTQQVAEFMQPCTSLPAGRCGMCNLAARGGSAQQSLARCALLLPSVQDSACARRMALVPQLNAGWANCFGTGDVTVVKEQVGAWEVQEAEGSSVKLEPLRVELVWLHMNACPCNRLLTKISFFRLRAVLGCLVLPFQA